MRFWYNNSKFTNRLTFIWWNEAIHTKLVTNKGYKIKIHKWSILITFILTGNHHFIHIILTYFGNMYSRIQIKENADMVFRICHDCNYQGIQDFLQSIWNDIRTWNKVFPDNWSKTLFEITFPKTKETFTKRMRLLLLIKLIMLFYVLVELKLLLI